jgi:hypothetical protein
MTPHDSDTIARFATRCQTCLLGDIFHAYLYPSVLERFVQFGLKRWRDHQLATPPKSCFLLLIAH